MSTDRGDKPLARDSFSKLITQIESLTKILESNETKPSPQEEEKKEVTKKICKMCGQFHKKPEFFWELEKMPRMVQLVR